MAGCFRRVVRVGVVLRQVSVGVYRRIPVQKHLCAAAAGGGRKMSNHVRSFASDRDLLRSFVKVKTISRESNYHPRAKELILAIQERKYDQAKKLVMIDRVPVDSHTRGEDTALTDAGARGDVKAIEFLITELKANPNASCDCPDHRTALHEASMKGWAAAVKKLLELGASDQTLTNSGKKPAALAMNSEIKQIFNSNNPLMKKLIGADTKNNVIYLS
ncbi:MAG: hypothetical protein Hyperionvirus2_195 [Hyperionvirus sp.]|uniref:Uncharacterized protein n=1 Tax=Hyperionvirus sp. TaxID=2487770 RepID=A0A3G5A6F4_9VIRU|nr:MAG: hypothetical protein Hyperionvirus2_195 [Hyperionvirus sp.]